MRVHYELKGSMIKPQYHMINTRIQDTIGIIHQLNTQERLHHCNKKQHKRSWKRDGLYTAGILNELCIISTQYRLFLIMQK